MAFVGFSSQVNYRAPDADHEVRWAVLKLAEIVVRGSEEVPPKFFIHLPPQTPVNEAPPSLPSVKLTHKPGRPIKSGGADVQSPLVPTATPKVRLLSGTANTDASFHKMSSTSVSTSATPLNIKKSVVIQPPLANDTLVHAPKARGRPPKPKEQKAIPKSQSSGMSLTDVKACDTALQRLMKSKHKKLFQSPVDPVRDRAPK